MPASTGEEALDHVAVLRAHIANLRRKVEPPGEHVSYPHRPGAGHRFAA